MQRSNFEDWIGDEDDEYYYQDRKQNNRRNRKKKKQQQYQQQEQPTWDWDDIYDPTRPNNYSDYKGSDEQFREHRDWKARLYYYQLKDAKKAKKGEEQPKKPTNSESEALDSRIWLTLDQACSRRLRVSASHRPHLMIALLLKVWTWMTMTIIINLSPRRVTDTADLLRRSHRLRLRHHPSLMMLPVTTLTCGGCA